MSADAYATTGGARPPSSETVIYVGHARRGPPNLLAVAAIVDEGGTTMVAHSIFYGGMVDFGDIALPPVSALVANLAAVLFGLGIAARKRQVTIVGALPETLDALKKPRVGRSWLCLTCWLRDAIEQRGVQLVPVAVEDELMSQLAVRVARDALEQALVGGLREGFGER